eukprot:scaffold55000_cov35-Tisochrysis_lutea.AAC.1
MRPGFACGHDGSGAVVAPQTHPFRRSSSAPSSSLDTCGLQLSAIVLVHALILSLCISVARPLSTLSSQSWYETMARAVVVESCLSCELGAVQQLHA